MKIEPISAHTKRSGLNVPSVPARAVPTSTGATAAGSVRGREATSQSRSGLTAPRAAAGSRCSAAAGSRSGAAAGPARSRALRELAEVGLSLLAVGVTALLRLLGHVEEEVGVVRELLDA